MARAPERSPRPNSAGRHKLGVTGERSQLSKAAPSGNLIVKDNVPMAV